MDAQVQKADQLLASGKLRSATGDDTDLQSGDGNTYPPHIFLPEQVDHCGHAVDPAQEQAAAATEELPWGLRFVLQAVHEPASKSVAQYKSLLLDAKPHRSKWYDPSRPGQGELYEALEKVLQDLKAFTPHSLPFLHRVNKKDVPDYHVVIKQPMDLSLMHKKLKSHEYASKGQFVQDLMLIYDNCITYNTAPDSPLRGAVRLLREKWTLLLAKVPDICIQTSDLSSSAAPFTDDVDQILDEHLKIVLSESSSEDEDEEGGVEEEDEGDDKVMEDETMEEYGELAFARSSMWPSRSGDLMRAFRRSQQQLPGELDAADWAFFCNSFPDTWSVNSKPAGDAGRGEEFSAKGIEEHLECIRLHSQLASSSAGVLDRKSLSGPPKIASALAAKKVALKLACLVLAAHGCDNASVGALLIIRDLLDVIVREAVAVVSAYNRRTDHDTSKLRQVLLLNAPHIGYLAEYKGRLERLRRYKAELVGRVGKLEQEDPVEDILVPPAFLPTFSDRHQEEVQCTGLVVDIIVQDTLSDVVLSDEEEYILSSEEVKALQAQSMLDDAAAVAAPQATPQTHHTHSTVSTSSPPAKKKRAKSNKET